MSIFIKKETISRLITDIKSIIKNPLNDYGIYYEHDDTDMLKGYAMIVGPENTPYFGGYYFFEFNYPENYPYSPPVVTYFTNGENVRFNPNLYTTGKVCLSLLNTWKGPQWSSCQTISTILISLQAIFCNNPFCNEPTILETNYEVPIYNELIQFYVFKIAIANIVTKKPGIYQPFFDKFYTHVKYNFNANYDRLHQLATSKFKNDDIQNKIYHNSYYKMTAILDYNIILAELNTAMLYLTNK